MLSEGAARLWTALERGDPAELKRVFPSAMGPTVRKVSDPVADVEDLIERASGGGGVRQPNKWLQSQRSKRTQLNLRPCCFARLQAVDSVLHRLPPTSHHECEGCGTVFEVTYRVREERRHAW